MYILLPVVFLVWGFVFYQLYTYFFAPAKYVTPVKEQKITLKELVPDTFSIVANYRDPFLGKKINYAPPKANVTVKKILPQKKAPKVLTPWPVIIYKGMIKNNNSNKRVGITQINGKDFLTKEGDIIQGVSCLEIHKDRIKVSFQKEVKIIHK